MIFQADGASLDLPRRITSLAAGLCLLLGGCHSQRNHAAPSITFNQVPVEDDEGGPDKTDTITGSVTNTRPGQEIVLYSRSGSAWWVQPFGGQPFTAIGPDTHWRASIHLGAEYAALLVEPGYYPVKKTATLPKLGSGVIAIATIKGREVPPRPVKILHFSGYDWKVRNIGSNRAGRSNLYDPANAWTDAHGALHLRIAKDSDKWTSAEVTLTSSLGYGRYVFIVRDVSHLGPAAVLGMFTWDEGAFDQNFREVDIEISRWGNPVNKNAQYVVQPYHISENVARFVAPAGVLTHSFRWEPGRISFETQRGSDLSGGSGVVAGHVFTAGIPSPGREMVHLNLCIAGSAKANQFGEAEVVIEKFEYFP